MLSHSVEVNHCELNFDGGQHSRQLKNLGCIKTPFLPIHVALDKLLQML